MIILDMTLLLGCAKTCLFQGEESHLTPSFGLIGSRLLGSSFQNTKVYTILWGLQSQSLLPPDQEI